MFLVTHDHCSIPILIDHRFLHNISTFLTTHGLFNLKWLSKADRGLNISYFIKKFQKSYRLIRSVLLSTEELFQTHIPRREKVRQQMVDTMISSCTHCQVETKFDKQKG